MTNLCVWRKVRPGLYAPGCMGGVVTDIPLILRPKYDYCPLCGCHAKYGYNQITDEQINRTGEFRRIGLQSVSKPFHLA